jgi:hypothetical protein
MASQSVPRVAVVAAVVSILAIYVFRTDAAAGLMVDDAWYIVLAKALAEGKGYALISSAAGPILPAVPPGFPFLLALVFSITGGFPANVVFLKAVSIAAAAVFGVAGYRYLTREERIAPGGALLIVTATLVTPALVFLATSTVMAELVFAAVQIGAVLWIERAVRDEPTTNTSTVVAALLSAAAMLVRTAAIALVVTAVVRCCLARRWRQGGIYLAMVIVALVPWQWYAYQHAPTDDQRVQHGGAMAYSYGQLMAMRRGGDLTRGQATLQDLPIRIGRNIESVVLRDVGALVAPALYRGASESGQEVVGVAVVPGIAPSMGAATGTKVVSLLLALVIVIGWYLSARARLSAAVLLLPITIAMILLVPDQTFRYSLPLTLFLLLFLSRGFAAIGRAISEPAGSAAARIAIAGLLGLNLVDHAQYIFLKESSRDLEWIADAREVDEVLTWMSTSLAEPGDVASTNPGLVYLRTGRRTVATDDLQSNWVSWRERHVRYVVALKNVELPPQRFGYRILHQTDRRKLWVVEICSPVQGDKSC